MSEEWYELIHISVNRHHIYIRLSNKHEFSGFILCAKYTTGSQSSVWTNICYDLNLIWKIEWEWEKENHQIIISIWYNMKYKYMYNYKT